MLLMYRPKWYCQKTAHNHGNDIQENRSSTQHIYVVYNAGSEQPSWQLCMQCWYPPEYQTQSQSYIHHVNNTFKSQYQPAQQCQLANGELVACREFCNVWNTQQLLRSPINLDRLT